jgi:hypothetical protein
MSIIRDLYNNLSVERALSPVVVGDDTPAVSEIIDMRGASALLFIIMTGTLADAGATFTTLLEESDNSGMSGANAVADADLLGTEAAASFIQTDDNEVFKLGYVGTKRYVRLTITPSGNASSAPIAVAAIKTSVTRGTVD